MGLMTAIGAAASIGGALLSSSAQKKAANTAARTAQDNTAANNALARDIYAQNQQALAPYQQRGNAAGDAINALLGIPSGFGGGLVESAQQRAQREALEAQYGRMPRAFEGAGSGSGMNDLLRDYNVMADRIGAPRAGGLFGREGMLYNLDTGAPIGVRDYGGFQLDGQPAQPFATTPAPAPAPSFNPQAAFDNYRNSTGYQFRLNQGNNAIGANFAARGLNNSGAAVRSAMRFGQDIASAEFGNYLGQLSNVAGMGLSGASAQAGVGTNYVNTVTANNNAGASAQANAALARGNANSMLYGGIANSLGNIFGSSFGR